MKRVLSLILLLVLTITVNAQPDRKRLNAEEYISLYKELAVVNMQEKKVPASITLAQAMFESDYGNSPLALHAKNHFGIKCHKEWSGETYHQDDDAAQECFRKYENPLQSFEDHSEFLKSRERYNSLFELDITDYKGWAHGLKKAGYATNPHYASRLIEIIERYELHLLDQGKDLPVCKHGDDIPGKKVVAKKEQKKPFSTTKPLQVAGMINNTPYIIAKRGDTFYSVAREQEMMLWQVLKYNDADKNDLLNEGDIVFLKPKRMNAETDFHVVQKGDKIHSISQQYGVKLNRLQALNNIAPGQEPSDGTKLRLR